MKLEVFLSRRYLSSRQGRGLSVITWIALAGVIVGVMSLITVIAVMSGFERDLRAKILGNNAHILVGVAGSREPLEKILGEVKKVPGVQSAMPVIYGEGFILGPTGASEGVMLRGVDPNEVRKVLDLEKYVASGNWDQFKGNAVIMGQALANRLDLMNGDSFTLVLNRGEFSPLGLVPKMKKLKVVDTFHSGMTQFDGHHGYMTLAEAAAVFETKPRSIEVRAADVRSIDEVRERIRHAVPEASLVTDWISQNSDFLSALKLEKTVMAIILGLIVLVASFNICGSLIMMVRDKTKDIAILKSMGARDSVILKIFFYQGMFIGVVGTIVGVILGVVLSILLRDYIKFPLNQEVYMIDTLPVDLRAADMLMVVVGALLISAVATLYPAWLASKINPTQGLKAD